MKVSIEELEAGDEIIISSYSQLKYMRVLVTPQVSKTKKHWRTGAPIFKDVKCAINKKQFENPHSHAIYHAFDLDPTDLNTIIYKDLANRDIWLVKKAPKI